MRGMHAIMSSLAMLALTMPREVDMPDVILNGKPSKGGNKIKSGRSCETVYSGGGTYLKPAELGRNEPCHCGSGKKHKKCCMGKTAVTDNETKA